MGRPGRENALEYDFTCATTAFNSSVESSPAKYGIALAGRPSRTVRRRSSSAGGSPAPVDLYLNLPDEKWRGNTPPPSGAPRSKSVPGGQIKSAYCAGSGRYSALGRDRPTRAQMERPTSSASNSTPKTSTTPSRERKNQRIRHPFAFKVDCLHNITLRQALS